MCADADFGEGKGRAVGGDQDIGAERDFQPAATADAVDGKDDRLIETTNVLKAPKAADTHVYRAAETIVVRSLHIPTGAEELLAFRREQQNAQFGIVAERQHQVADRTAGRSVNGIGGGAVKVQM